MVDNYSDQTIAGDKTFSGDLNVSSITTTNTITANQVTTAYGFYHDRGNVAAWDKSTNWTTNGTWVTTGANALDLSSVVPAGAKAIVFRIDVTDDTAGASIQFRPNGSTNTFACPCIATQVTNRGVTATLIVGCGTNRIIDYWATNVDWTEISLVVLGWFY